MIHPTSWHDSRSLLEAILTELALYARELCPAAQVEASALRYEDEDGRVEVFPPPGLSEAEEEQIEMALAARSAALFAQTGLYVPCAVLDVTAR
jgi:hypothetical protein